MRTFRDSSGIDWTVFEVRRQFRSRDASYLPAGFTSGWLCFEHGTTKKRLVRFPERWRELTDAELGQLLVQAQLAPRAAFPLGDDLTGDLSPSPDARPD